MFYLDCLTYRQCLTPWIKICSSIDRLSKSYGIRWTGCPRLVLFIFDRSEAVGSVQWRCVDSKNSQVRSPSGLGHWSTAIHSLHGRFGLIAAVSRYISMLMTLSSICCSKTVVLYDEVRQRMKCGIEKISRWMESDRLRMNPSKTDFLWCATRRRCHRLTTDPMLIEDASLTLSFTVRDLGVILQSDISMPSHVNQIDGQR